MSPLGIYFGPKFISVSEIKGKKLANSLKIPNLSFSPSVDEKVPEEVKIVALFKDELRKAKIDAKEANLAFSGNDLIIRTFEVPDLPANELSQAVNFEIKKYIPFKLEELIFDFQAQFDKGADKNFILFVGIKKEILEKYLSIFRQLKIKIVSLEYSAFSLFKLINLAGGQTKGVAAVINADPSGNDEANFTVAEDNFPLFSRDIPLAHPAQAGEAKPEEAGMFIEKLNTEIRISLDYYNRKFAQKKINRILLVGGQEISSPAGAFVKELGFSFSFVDPSRLIGKPGISDPGILKSFSSALFGQLKPVVKINLLSAWSRSRQSKEGASFMPPGLANALSGLKLEKKFLVSAGLIVAAGIALGAFSLIPIEHQINEIISSRLKVPQLNESPTLEELSGLESKYNQKVSDLNNLIKKQLYFTPELAVIPKILPEGVWLDDFSFVNSKTRKEFSLEGKIYLQDSQRESAALEALLLALKNDANFSKNFPDIRIISVDAVNINASPVTQFKIFGTKQQKRQEEYEP